MTRGRTLAQTVVRVAGAVIVAILLALLVANGRSAGDDEGSARDAAQDVPAATAALAQAVTSLQTECSDLAARALDATSETNDREHAFRRLATLRLPPRTGVRVEDRDGNLVAWAGEPLLDEDFRDIPRTRDGMYLVETPGVRRLAVCRRRSTPLDGVPVVAICHQAFEVRPPLTNRFQSQWSLADDVVSQYDTGRAAVVATVLAAPSAAQPGTVAVPNPFGESVVAVHVAPMDSDAVSARAAARADHRRVILLLALVATGLVWAWVEAGALAARRPAAAACLRAAAVVAARLGLGATSLAALADAGGPRHAPPLLDVGHYSHASWLALAETPLDLLATCIAALGAAYCVRRALLASPAARRSSPVVALAATLATAIACRGALHWLIDDVVRNSTVAFFPDDSVLPRPASAALLTSLFAAGAAAVILVVGVWRRLAPPDLLGRGATAVAGVAAAAALVPLGWTQGWAAAPLAGVLAVLAMTAAIVPALLDAGAPLRAALAPLGVALGLFAPLDLRLETAVRENVASYAADRIRSSDGTERQFVRETLRRVATSPEIRAAIRARRIPRELLLRYWAGSPLAQRLGGSAIEVRPLRLPSDPSDFGDVSFGVNLPPGNLQPAEQPGGEGETPRLLPGQGSMGDGRWLVAEADVTDVSPTGGEERLARVRVILEVRAPSFLAVPELRVVGAKGSTDQLERPALSVTQYAANGTMIEIETNDPYRPAGTVLDPALREECVGGGGAAWREVRVADKDLAVVVLPEGRAPDVTGFQAFSYDTGGVKRTALRAARAALYGAIFSAILLLATARSWTVGTRLRLAHRLVASFVVVSGLPLLVLGWANREFAEQRAADTTTAELRQSTGLIESILRQPKDNLLGILGSATEQVRERRLREVAYGVGHHFSVFFDGELRSSSDLGLFDTQLLARRLPADVYREMVLLRRPFYATPVMLGESTFDVGYHPLHDERGDLLGVISVPLLQQRRQRDRELADGVTAILALYLLSLAAAVAVGTWIASRVTAPLRDLAAATQRVAKGDLTQPVPPGGNDELGEVVRGFNRMMSDLAESRERLVRAEKEAAWRDMARQVAHEVKNPLTPMRLAAEHIRRAWRDKHPQFDELLTRSVDVIVRQTESLKQIATAFSDFARLSGKRREPVDLADAVRGVTDLYRATEGLTTRLDIAAGLAPAATTVLADPDELRRVLVNVAKNAVEAMEPSAAKPGTLTVSLTRDAAAPFLVLRITDDGPGIPADVLPRLFEPYFSTKTSGTGLGLAICKRAIEDFGGSIGIESTAGKGTTVTIRLPAAPSTSTAAAPG